MFHFLPGNFNGTACLEQYLEDTLQVGVLADRIVEAARRKLTFQRLTINFSSQFPKSNFQQWLYGVLSNKEEAGSTDSNECQLYIQAFQLC